VKFRHVEVFYAIMTNGTVTEAARQLGVSQPSVTTTLKQAESRLGIQLFQREGGRLIPTEEARILFEEAERAHYALEAISILAKRLQIGRGGYVRIATVPTLSFELLPDAIERFEARHTGFRYSVASMNTEEMLNELDSRKGTFHLGVTFGAQDDSGLVYTDIGNAELYAVLPADWDIADGTEIRLEQLEGRPFISGFDHTALALECRRLFADAAVEPRIVARSHMYLFAGCLVQRGIGCTILDALTVRALLDSRRAASIAVRRIVGQPSLRVAAVFPSQRRLSNAASVFVECFQQAYDALSARIREQVQESAAPMEP
jgi:DNA-binding transcriptional LysR family regulator